MCCAFCPWQCLLNIFFHDSFNAENDVSIVDVIGFVAQQFISVLALEFTIHPSAIFPFQLTCKYGLSSRGIAPCVAIVCFPRMYSIHQLLMGKDSDLLRQL